MSSLVCNRLAEEGRKVELILIFSFRVLIVFPDGSVYAMG